MPLTNVRDKPLHKLKVENKQSLRSSQAAGLGKWRIETLNSPASPAKRGEQLSTLNSNGFSLIEVLLSVFLITTLVTILLTSSGTLFTTYNSRLQSQASKIASRKIENLRNTSFSSLPSGGTNTSCTNDADLTTDLTKLKNASCSLTVTNYDTPVEASTQIKWATVTIKWDNDKGVQQTLDIDTLIYKEGL